MLNKVKTNCLKTFPKLKSTKVEEKALSSSLSLVDQCVCCQLSKPIPNHQRQQALPLD